MKQHITPKQAEEITEEQFYSLFPKGIVKRNDWANFHHKKVTIGKMLELLSDNIIYWKMDEDRYSRVGMVSDDDSVFLKDFREKNLCDTLWQAVKSKIS